MTLIEAISIIDNIKPNTYTQAQKIAWLSELDGRIRSEILSRYSGETNAGIPYTEDSLYTELLIPFPYGDIYIKWLEASIDYANGEYGKYNNSMTMFNAKLSDYANQYNRTHMPKGEKFKFF